MTSLGRDGWAASGGGSWLAAPRAHIGPALASLRRALPPLALLAAALHVVLTVSSWRYSRASLLIWDMSPSMALASGILLFWGPTLPACGLWSKELVAAEQAPPVPSIACSVPTPAARTESHNAEHAIPGGAAPVRGAGAPAARTSPNPVCGWPGRLVRKLFQGSRPAVIQRTLERADLLRKAGLRRMQSAASGRGQAPSGWAGRDGASSVRSGSSVTGGDCSSGGGLARRARQRPSSASGVAPPRWQPSMTRIASGQHLPGLQDDSNASVATTTVSRQPSGSGLGPRSSKPSQHFDAPAVSHTGHLAVDCLQHDTTTPDVADVTQVVTPQHLLQFGALLGESSAELALGQMHAPGAMGPAPTSLLGPTDRPEQWAQGWEHLVGEACARRGLQYRAWRRYLRKGLYAYMSRTVFDGVTPPQLAAFYFDMQYKVQWDDACTQLVVLPPPSACSPAVPYSAEQDGEWQQRCLARSAFLYARSRFPAPMAQREYLYARRVWAKADDGGAYLVSRNVPSHPGQPTPGGRTVRVQDFVSATVLRESAAVGGAGVASEIVTVYFEDSSVAPGIMNLGVRKALWPMIQRMDAALRAHTGSAAGAAALHATASALSVPPPAPDSTTLPAAMSPSPSSGSLMTQQSGQAAEGPCGAAQGGMMKPTLSAPTLLSSRTSPLPLPLQLSSALQHTRSLLGLSTAASGAQPPVRTVGLQRKDSRQGQGLEEVASTKGGDSLAPDTTAWDGHRAVLRMLLALWAMLLAAHFRVLAALRWAVGGVGLVGLQRRLWRLQRRKPPSPDVTSHPVDMAGDEGHDRPSGERSAKRSRPWGRRFAARLALLAVRVAGMPLAHRVLTRSTADLSRGAMEQASPPPASSAPFSRTNSMTSQGGDTTRGLRAGRGGAGLLPNPSNSRASTARVLHWLDPSSTPMDAYLIAQSPELMGAHVAHAELQGARRRLGRAQGTPRGSRDDSAAASAAASLSSPRNVHLRPSLGVVVDGVALARPWSVGAPTGVTGR